MFRVLLLLLLTGGAAAGALSAVVEKMEETQGGCSACNIIASKLDDAIQNGALIQGWADWTPTQRAATLRKVLKRGCRKISDMEILVGGRATKQTIYVDVAEMKKQGQEVVEKMLSELDSAPGHSTALASRARACACPRLVPRAEHLPCPPTTQKRPCKNYAMRLPLTGALL